MQVPQNSKKICTSVEYDNLGRVYVFDDGSRFHSVTTMLSNTSDKINIDIWRNQLGHEQADRETKIAGHLGEQFHLLGEYYLNGKPLPLVNQISTHIFNTSTRHILNQNITDVISVEEPLYSDKYKIAGRTDAVVGWNKKLAILDFKLLNSSDKTWLKDYWIQTTIYAYCWYEMYGEMPELLVLVIGNKKSFDTVYYTARPKSYIKDMNYRFFQFNSLLENM